MIPTKSLASPSTLADITHVGLKREFVYLAVVRGTLQFVAAPDIRWMLKFLAPDLIAPGAPSLQIARIRFGRAVASSFASIRILTICSAKLK